MCIEFKPIIPKLIDIIKDQVGNKRKSGAIFLAKLGKNPENIELIRKLHGIEILASVQKFIVNN